MFIKKCIFALLGLGVLLASSCKDEPYIPSFNPEENDRYLGRQNVITLWGETEDFGKPDFVCILRAEDGSLISRKGAHLRMGGKSTLTFETGLKPGVYRLLCLRTPEVPINGDTVWNEFGLGCRVEISETDTARVLDYYSKVMKMSGHGTEDDPFIVSSPDHLKRLRSITNDQIKNNLLLPKTHFRQMADIDMDKASWDSDHEFGWLAIGNMPNNPFRGIYDGNGYRISNLWAKRGNSAGIGLFGYSEKAVFKNITMSNPNMEGNFAVGAIVGGAVSAGNKRDKTALFGCSTSGGYISAGKGSVGVGGLVGNVDTYGMILLDSCSNLGTSVSGAYGVGGLLGTGSLYSQSYLQKCENIASVTSDFTGAGGMVGSVDSLFVISCTNSGLIKGSKAYNPNDNDNGGYGTGGIAGGTGVSYIYSSTNNGEVKGHTGVGGIIGSTRVGSEELMFNNTLVKSCRNNGNIEGEQSVGGVCGEAQFGCYAVYNTGEVKALGSGASVGGIVGNSSIAVAHNALNTGRISGTDLSGAGGIVGTSTWGAVFACQNLGDIDVSARYTGGILGLGGNYTMMNYCFNSGYIQNGGNGPTGGLIGEIGDPRNWSFNDIASCVLGGTECVLGMLGPVIAVAGEALEGGASIAEKALGKLVHVLHITETALDWTTMIADGVYFAEGITEMVTEEEAELIETSLKENMAETDASVKAEMKSLRENAAAAQWFASPEFDTATMTQYMLNINNLLSFYEASDENNAVINFNINNNREERYEKLEQDKKTQEIVQKVIAGTCICVAATTAVASIFVTGGTSTAIALTAVGAIATVIGGVNAIVEGATDFQNNAAIVSQCVNMGKVKADGADKVGGVAGHLQQYVVLKDCLNLGSYEGSANKNGGIVGRGDSRSETLRCLNIGKGWGDPLVNSSGDFVDHSGLYFYSPLYPGYSDTNMPAGMKGLGLSELKNKNSYNGWDINGANSKWELTNTDGYFPVPFNSEMQEEVEE